MNLKELEKRIEKLENKLELLTPPEVKWIKIGDFEWSENLGEMTWQEAMDKAKELGARVPTRIELINLFDNHYKECEKLIEDSPSYYFWSAAENGSADAWYVALSSGTTNGYSKAAAGQLRCVREEK